MTRPSGFKGLVDCMLGTVVPCFGEAVEYRPKAGGRVNIKAVFDEQFLQVDNDTEQVIASNDPMIGVRLRDLKREPVQGDGVRIGKRFFEVMDSQEDGQGGASIFLRELKDNDN